MDKGIVFELDNVKDFDSDYYNIKLKIKNCMKQRCTYYKDNMTIQKIIGYDSVII